MILALVERRLRAVDPCEDAAAEPLGLAPIAVLAVAIAVSVGVFLRWKIQPMQDLGHHMAFAAIAYDHGREGSIYPAVYERMDPLYANTLLYSVTRVFAPLFGVSAALRITLSSYLAGVPLATLYAARVFGRSPWVAVLAVPLCHQQLFIAGVANNLFGASLFVLALPLFFRALERPTFSRAAFLAGLVFALFLAHAHLFLWFGVLACGMTLHRALVGLRVSPRDAVRTAGLAFGIVTPALLVFARWYARTFSYEHPVGPMLSVTVPASRGFGAVFTPPAQLFANLATHAWKTLRTDGDLRSLVVLLALVLAAIVVSRRHSFAAPAVMETAFAVTLLSYFVLPENISGHDGIGSRQLGVALWLLPCLVSPVPEAVAPWGRRLVVGGILLFSLVHGRAWLGSLLLFQRTEAAGLEKVLAAAPPRLRLHYVKSDMESGIFRGGAFGHVEKLYMADGLGDTDDVPAFLATAPIHFRPTANPHRITFHGPTWPRATEIWEHFDLVLTRRWRPAPEDLALAREHADLLEKSGDWELWRVRR